MSTSLPARICLIYCMYMYSLYVFRIIQWFTNYVIKCFQSSISNWCWLRHVGRVRLNSFGMFCASSFLSGGHFTCSVSLFVLFSVFWSSCLLLPLMPTGTTRKVLLYHSNGDKRMLLASYSTAGIFVPFLLLGRGVTLHFRHHYSVYLRLIRAFTTIPGLSRRLCVIHLLSVCGIII